MRKLGKVTLGLMMVLGLCACGKMDNEEVVNIESDAHVTVNIVADGNTVYSNLEVPVIEGDTIANIMERVEELYQIDFVTEDSQYGLFLASIEGIDNDSNEYWMVYENGELADEGVSSEDSLPNDVITFSLESFE